ncbi:helix-turn-helix transcriptional regulator [Arsenicicoccus dermatophilus]|uniref:helix-turn-helix transcriptional regulator n=1 Tax=Arsenicicoccus dermatophilus TaxID=1076331 RepID=UPI001F4D1F21|nr:helix-turn-helix domain-containing protein [Arsenicicoccus dermatophilus]MCH8613564.1 helix-turn-helix domain-containing protein [Arsenicicoccus dermatophilus]
MTTREAAAFLGLSVGHLCNLRSQGKGPAYSKMPGGHCRYRLADLKAYLGVTEDDDQ